MNLDIGLLLIRKKILVRKSKEDMLYAKNDAHYSLKKTVYNGN